MQVREGMQTRPCVHASMSVRGHGVFVLARVFVRLRLYACVCKRMHAFAICSICLHVCVRLHARVCVYIRVRVLPCVREWVRFHVCVGVYVGA